MFYFPSTYREYFYSPTIRADTRVTWRQTINVIQQIQQIPMRKNHLTGTDVRFVRPSLIGNSFAKSSLGKGRTGRTSVPANHIFLLFKNSVIRVILLIIFCVNMISQMKQLPCGVK